MYKFLSCLFLLNVLVSCNTEPTIENKVEKSSIIQEPSDYTGTWDFITKDTPIGDYKGDLILKKEGGKYVGVIIHNELNYPMEELKIEGNRMKFRISYEGYRPHYEGTFNGEVFNGNLTIRGRQFEISAIKKSVNS